jgi:phosphoribosylformylglycinamidine synthase
LIKFKYDKEFGGFMFRIYVQKKREFDVFSDSLRKEILTLLGIDVEEIKIINVYDIDGIEKDTFELSKGTVFSEPNVDETFDRFSFIEDEKGFRVEYLKGQYDQRADSAQECVRLLDSKSSPSIISSKLYVFKNIEDDDLQKVKKYLINPVESYEVPVFENTFNIEEGNVNETIQVLNGFITYSEKDLKRYYLTMGLAMSFDDFKYIQTYFKGLEKDPTITEIRVLDTYWSDHCRHTTFNTFITDVDMSKNNIKSLKETYETYLEERKVLGRNGYISLMDLAIINARIMRKEGYLNDLEISDEINAASIEVDVDVDSQLKKYLVSFKNETHNHPTEIEPFGGAATCLGGAIRDPLSGRAYVYQSMRISGAADPFTKVEDTIDGKLMQKYITTNAAHGFSSYGNQIGLQTGYVREYYHDDFVAKRMEVGFVVGASPRENVVRKEPKNGDLVLLIGGRTGRDGIGGATGSSKVHDIKSVEKSGAEVQKGNAPTQRKLQRLILDPTIASMIIRSNDFGAGGVSVAIGEIANSVEVNLDNIPLKYQGLDGTEIAISESQERMAVVIEKHNLDSFIAKCNEENIESAVVGMVTDTNKFVIKWKNNIILDLDREFIDSSGVSTYQNIELGAIDFNQYPRQDFSNLDKALNDYNVCSQRGLIEMFDNTIGTTNLLTPFGGKYLATPVQGMASKIPTFGGSTNTCTVVTNGYNPQISKFSPFHGGSYAVVESLSKQLSMGADLSKVRLTFQEYFERLSNDPKRWAKPLSALLGAKVVMDKFKLAAIGGKDSMSGTYTLKDSRIDVPPTLISFALSINKVKNIITPQFKKKGSKVYLFEAKRNLDMTYDIDKLANMYSLFSELHNESKIFSAYTVEQGGVDAALFKMAIGNRIGIDIKFDRIHDYYLSIIVETDMDIVDENVIFLGTTGDKFIINFEEFDLENLNSIYEGVLEPIFHTKTDSQGSSKLESKKYENIIVAKNKIATPNAFLPIFPGTNCEIDTRVRFNKAGANVTEQVFRNLTKTDIDESIDLIVKNIKQSQIIALSGGFSAGDEPDGSGKFIATVFRNEKVMNALDEFLRNDGLMIGICNGFQALVKLGLVPYGQIKELDKNDPTLTFNTIGRHQAGIINTKVVSNKSPWLRYASMNEIYKTPISHGEGRFFADEKTIKTLMDNGQIALQYVDLEGNPTMDSKFNPNGSTYAIESITNPDGRIIGKMGHNERVMDGLYKNLNDIKELKLFEAGVDYFK